MPINNQSIYTSTLLITIEMNVSREGICSNLNSGGYFSWKLIWSEHTVIDIGREEVMKKCM